MNGTTETAPKKVAVTPKQNSALPRAPCILLVDDDKDARQLSLEVLTDAGYLVEDVRDGAAGWKALQINNYDLVVTDNKMPKLTGIEMIAKLRSAGITVPIIMATEHLPMHEFDRKPWLKPHATLQRPFSNDDLLKAVKKVLGTDGSIKLT